MDQLVGYFEEYLGFIDVPITNDGDEGHFKVKFTNAEIVNKLLLWHTMDSSGISTARKCRELGLDAGGTVIFEDERGKE